MYLALHPKRGPTLGKYVLLHTYPPRHDHNSYCTVARQAPFFSITSQLEKPPSSPFIATQNNRKRRKTRPALVHPYCVGKEPRNSPAQRPTSVPCLHLPRQHSRVRRQLMPWARTTVVMRSGLRLRAKCAGVDLRNARRSLVGMGLGGC